MPAHAEKHWFLIRDGRQHGPLTDKELRLLIRGGYLKRTDRIEADLSAHAPPAATPGNLNGATKAEAKPAGPAANRLRAGIERLAASTHQAIQSARPRVLPRLTGLAAGASAALSRSLRATELRLHRLDLQTLLHPPLQRFRTWRAGAPVKLGSLRLNRDLLLVASAAVILGTVGFLGSSLLPRSSPAPPQAPSPIAWSFDAGQPLLISTRTAGGTIVIEGLAVEGDNRSADRLERVQAQLRGDRSDLMLRGALALAGDPSPDILPADVPPRSRFTVRFLLPSPDGGRGLPLEQFLATYGGFTFTFRYVASGKEHSVFQHLPREALESELAPLRQRR